MTNKPKIRVKALSGAGSKAPACFLVETGTARFLLDLGEGPAQDMFPDLSEVGIIDAVLISHGHNDHIGGLHLVDQIGYPPIYATSMTRSFAGHPRLATARELPLNGRVDIAGVVVETGRSGHAAGAIWMRIGGEDGVLYSGDFCTESPLYPVDKPLRAATLIIDASYGLYDDDLAPAVQTLIARAQRAPLLLPLPSTGRGVEIAVLLHEAGLPVSLCAQHRRVAQLMVDAPPGALTPDAPHRLATMLQSSTVLAPDSPPLGVMIAANGGANAGLARTLLERFRTDTAIQILFTGHVDNGTPASAAITSGRAAFLRWNVHPRLRDLIWLHDTVRPAETILAFCTPADMSAVAQRLTEH